jgi:hypothetical protein
MGGTTPATPHCLTLVLRFGAPDLIGSRCHAPPVPGPPDVDCPHCDLNCNSTTGACGNCTQGWAQEADGKCTKCADGYHLYGASTCVVGVRAGRGGAALGAAAAKVGVGQQARGGGAGPMPSLCQPRAVDICLAPPHPRHPPLLTTTPPPRRRWSFPLQMRNAPPTIARTGTAASSPGCARAAPAVTTCSPENATRVHGPGGDTWGLGPPSDCAQPAAVPLFAIFRTGAKGMRPADSQNTHAPLTPAPPLPPPTLSPDIDCEHCASGCNPVTGACGTCAPGYAKDYALMCTKCAGGYHLEGANCTAGGWRVAGGWSLVTNENWFPPPTPDIGAPPAVTPHHIPLDARATTPQTHLPDVPCVANCASGKCNVTTGVCSQCSPSYHFNASNHCVAGASLSDWGGSGPRLSARCPVLPMGCAVAGPCCRRAVLPPGLHSLPPPRPYAARRVLRHAQLRRRQLQRRDWCVHAVPARLPPQQQLLCSK